MCESPTPATQIQAPKARSLTAIRFDTHCGRPPRVRESLTQAKQIQAPRGKRREEEEGGGEEGGGRQRPECNSKRVPNHRRVGNNLNLFLKNYPDDVPNPNDVSCHIEPLSYYRKARLPVAAPPRVCESPTQATQIQAPGREVPPQSVSTRAAAAPLGCANS